MRASAPRNCFVDERLKPNFPTAVSVRGCSAVHQYSVRLMTNRMNSESRLSCKRGGTPVCKFERKVATASTSSYRTGPPAKTSSEDFKAEIAACAFRMRTRTIVKNDYMKIAYTTELFHVKHRSRKMYGLRTVASHVTTVLLCDVTTLCLNYQKHYSLRGNSRSIREVWLKNQ